jgi:hypothetical protein
MSQNRNFLEEKLVSEYRMKCIYLLGTQEGLQVFSSILPSNTLKAGRKEEKKLEIQYFSHKNDKILTQKPDVVESSELFFKNFERKLKKKKQTVKFHTFNS